MMKRGLQPSSGSVGIPTCPTCNTDGNTNLSSTIDFPPLLSSSSSVPELIDHYNRSISSSEFDDSSTSSSDEEFKISNFQNFKISVGTSSNHSSHNLSLSQASKMEFDCVNNSTPSVKVDGGSSNQDHFMQMLNVISNKMMDTIQDLQHQLLQKDLKYTLELQKLSKENETFRQNIIADMQQSNLGTNPVTVSNQVSPSLATSPSMASPIIPSSGLSTTLSSDHLSQDFQQQMMTMLNATFTKLTTVIADSKPTDSKSDWPKFARDMKKFKHWFLAVVAQLSLMPWKEFYDYTNNTLVKTTESTALNEKLYAKLLLCLESQVFQDMVSRKHLRANGLLLLCELSQTYRPSHVPEVIAAKTVEFWSTLKRSPSESVDAYYNRFQAILDDLKEAGEPIPVGGAIQQFLFTLGADFAPIQNNYRISLLPDAWKTTDWPSLLVLCRDYANSV